MQEARLTIDGGADLQRPLHGKSCLETVEICVKEVKGLGESLDAIANRQRDEGLEKALR